MLEHKKLNEKDVKKAYTDITKEQDIERQKKEHYSKDIRKIIMERKEQKKLDQLMLLSTLSPGGKIKWVYPG